jgi:hypothetical protein
LFQADANTILRIHGFLESWGLINYIVDPGTLPVMSTSIAGLHSGAPVFTYSAHEGVKDSFVQWGSKEREFAERKAAITGPSWAGYPLPLWAKKTVVSLYHYRSSFLQDVCSSCGDKLLKSKFVTTKNEMTYHVCEAW